MKSVYTLNEAIEALKLPVELTDETRETLERSVGFLRNY